MTNQTFLKFETDFVESLRCIPMIVRMKLDTCGIKLKLDHWNKFSQLERQSLVTLPCSDSQEIDNYREFLQNLVIAKTGNPAKELAVDEQPLWLNANEIPETVQTKAAEFAVEISQQQWSNLNPLQRFALIKLSRPSHENLNFLPALKEFGIIEERGRSST